MIEKLKSAFTYILGFITLILGALFYAQKRKTESVESELASEKAQGAIRLNESERLAAKAQADDLLDAYEKLKNEDQGK